VLVTGDRPLPPHDVPTLHVGADARPWRAGPDDLVGPDDAASIVYTSGSTGRPRGTVGTHGALANRLRWAAREWSQDADDIRVVKSSMSFIDGTTELLGALVAGATAVIADEDTARDAAALGELSGGVAAGQLLVVPSLAAAMAESAPTHLGSIRRWICSGEPLDTVTGAAAGRAGRPDRELLRFVGGRG
jgi:acyl-coenzyme A synthetase/AMP-(fatty) acid ligase